MKYCVAFLILFVNLFFETSFVSDKTKVTTLVIAERGNPGIRHDTAFVIYDFTGKYVQDSIDKYVAKKYDQVKTIFIGQPSRVLDSIDFEPYKNLKILILAGDDEDYIDSLHYGFFEIESLQKIIVSSVWVLNSNGVMDDNCISKQHFISYINASRPDVHLRFRPMGKYNEVGWPDFRFTQK